jgi:transposase
MIHTTNIKTIYLATYRVDFRRGHWKLLAEAYHLGLNPLSSDLLVFVSSKRNKIKLLYSDPTGLWVSYKAYHEGAMKTLVRLGKEAGTSQMTQAELAMLIEGTSFTVHKRLSPLIVKD